MKTLAIISLVGALVVIGQRAPKLWRSTVEGDVLHFAWGTEDFAHDPSGGRLLVSAQDRRPIKRRQGKKGKGRPEGGIWQVAVRAGKPVDPRQMPRVGRTSELPFHPVGISIYHDPRTGTRHLFVINRDDDRRTRTIERYAIDGDTLRFEREWRSDFLRSPNEILALGPNRFYVSNDSRSRRKLIAGVEKLLQLPSGDVVELREGRWSVAISRLSFANGLAVDRDGDILWVAEFNARRVHSFSGVRSGHLTRTAPPIRLEDHPDNLLWEDATRLVVAAHQNPLATFRHLRDPAKSAPTAVYRIDTNLRDTVERLVPANVSAGSTALVIDGHLIVSHLVGNGLWFGTLESPSIEESR